jgi:hypothetical protein
VTTDEQLRFRAPLGAIVLIHFFVLLWHGAMQVEIPVPLTASETIFVVLIIFLTPLAGAGLLWTSYRTAGVWLIILAMLGSLLFGFINHFIRATPDYVLAVPPSVWRHSFVVSAALLAVIEMVGTMMGVVALAPHEVT